MGHTCNENDVKDTPYNIRSVSSAFDGQIKKLSSARADANKAISEDSRLTQYYREYIELLERIMKNSNKLFSKSLSDPTRLEKLIDDLTALNAYLENPSPISAKTALCRVGWAAPSVRAGIAILAIGLLVAVVALITLVSPYFALLLVPVVLGGFSSQERIRLDSDIRRLVEHHNPYSFRKATDSHWFFSSSNEVSNDKETVNDAKVATPTSDRIVPN